MWTSKMAIPLGEMVWRRMTRIWEIWEAGNPLIFIIILFRPLQSSLRQPRNGNEPKKGVSFSPDVPLEQPNRPPIHGKYFKVFVFHLRILFVFDSQVENVFPVVLTPVIHKINQTPPFLILQRLH